MENRQIEPRVSGISGLILVRSGRYHYVGKMAPKTEQEAAQKLLGRGHVALTDCFELAIGHRQTTEGIQTTINPMPIPLHDSACDFVVRVDGLVDVSHDAALAPIFRAMTGGKGGIILPGTAPMPDLFGGRHG